MPGFSFNTRGEADGFLLQDNRQVHLPPHLSGELLRKVKVGDEVWIRGVKPRGADLITAVSLTGQRGVEIMDHGPHENSKAAPAPRPGKPVQIHGCVQPTLYAPKGEVCGALLDGGEIVRMRPKENIELAPYFVSGINIAVWGDAIVVRGQKVIDLGEVAFQD